MAREKTYGIEVIGKIIFVSYFGNKVSFELVFDNNGKHVDPWVGQKLSGTFPNMITSSRNINYTGMEKFGVEAKKAAQNYLAEKYKDEGKKVEGEKDKGRVLPWWA